MCGLSLFSNFSTDGDGLPVIKRWRSTSYSSVSLKRNKKESGILPSKYFDITPCEHLSCLLTAVCVLPLNKLARR